MTRIEWHGGNQPAPDDVKVMTQLRMARNGEMVGPYRAREVSWWHVGISTDVVAYAIFERPSAKP